MIKLSALFKIVREAQGIRQKDLGMAVGLNQSAIAQYEGSALSLSAEASVGMASALNINPDYVESGIGNPFKARDKSKLIKMLFPETIDGEVDPILVDIILDHNSYISCILMTPEKLKKRTTLRQPGYFFALLVRDEDGNVFLFRHRDKDRWIGMTGAWLEKLQMRHNEKIEHGGYVLAKPAKLSDQMFEKIREWTVEDVREFDDFLLTIWPNSREGVLKLIDLLSSLDKNSERRAGYRKAANYVLTAPLKDLDGFLDRILVKIEQAMRRG